MPKTDLPLLHMDADSRNRRLYGWLMEMGLCVFPVSAPDEPDKIDYLMVSVDLPLKVSQGIPAESLRDNVVLMPPVGR